ncbi:hypothetical protein PHMEG_00020152 [Phytophthora megakarya]|uniref:PiggyBac transposable element-derived protein domain-containing protein n=1 Tax=Phytophthora megakarya TaxID=4795 RepID=A0A225VQ48_9STRA|nr:hypothetical protein PHMEG_00020152 [Phytophthora megakarya]
MAWCYKQFYKSFFLGIIDLVVVNAFIMYNCRRIKDGKGKATHVEFLNKLPQARRLDLIDMSSWHASHPYKAAEGYKAHVPIHTDEWRKYNSDATRKPARLSVLKTAAKNAQAARAFLCNKLKFTSNGKAIPCFEIWHRHRKLPARKSTVWAVGDSNASDI